MAQPVALKHALELVAERLELTGSTRTAVQVQLLAR
jgi:hypothetical protein